jgi:hypothetical protein
LTWGCAGATGLLRSGNGPGICPARRSKEKAGCPVSAGLARPGRGLAAIDGAGFNTMLSARGGVPSPVPPAPPLG